MTPKRTRASSPKAHRHAGSHAFATLMTTLTSGLLVAYYKERLYVLVKGLRKASLWLITTYDIPFTVDTMTSVLVATVLSAGWGIAFHYTHK